MPYGTIRLFNICVDNKIAYLRAKTNKNQGKSDIIAKRKIQALFRNKQKSKYDNHIQIMLMNINDVTI